MIKLSALSGMVLVLLAMSVESFAAEPLIVAHRGLLRHAPENTLANFRACLELRLGFEFDVQRTKDGHLVCIHDDTVERTTNGTGAVSELSFSDIRELDAGSWFDSKFRGEKVPTIDDVLKLLAKYRQYDILVAVDLKSEDVETDVVKLGMKYDVLDKLIFIGRTISEPDVRKRILDVSSAAQVAMVANTAKEFPNALNDENVDWIYVRYLPTADEVDRAHQADKRLFIAGTTVAGELPANWRHAADVGVDGILTDYPLELRSALRP